MTILARAHPNIALVKYWGKRDDALNLPAVGSLSVTLGEIATQTRIREIAGPDVLTLDGAPMSGAALERVAAHVALLRGLADARGGVEIHSINDFPTASGLASSASGFAALTLGLARLWRLPHSLQGLSELARRGSGSAARSLHGGFVEWRRGGAADGSDSVAVPLAPASWWDLRVVIAVLARGPKAVGSRAGMARSAQTSPCFAPFVDGQEADLAAARAALERRDLAALGEIAEASCLKMVATWLTARPPLHYWRPETLAVVQAVGEMRAEGLPAWFTTDAGPHVKVLCPAEAAPRVQARLEGRPEVLRVLSCPVGGPATVEDAP